MAHSSFCGESGRATPILILPSHKSGIIASDRTYSQLILLAEQVRIQKLERQLKETSEKAEKLPMAKFADSNVFNRLDDLEAPPKRRIYSKIIPKKYKMFR